MDDSTRRRSLFKLVFVGVFLPAVAYSILSFVPRSNAPASDSTSTYEEVVVALVTASFCVASQREELLHTWPAIVEEVRENAARENQSVRTMGVSIDVDPMVGVAALSRYGEFDEIVSGSNWANVASRIYIWDNHPGRAAIPQVLVIRRLISHGLGGYEVVGEEVVSRMVGVSEIERW